MIRHEDVAAALEVIRQYLGADESCGVAVWNFSTSIPTSAGIFVHAPAQEAAAPGEMVPLEDAPSSTYALTLEPLNGGYRWLQTYGPAIVKVTEQ